MEYTNDVIFNIKYSKEEDKLYFKKQRKIYKIFNFAIKNKAFTTLIILASSFIVVDCIMIAKFVKILNML